MLKRNSNYIKTRLLLLYSLYFFILEYALVSIKKFSLLSSLWHHCMFILTLLWIFFTTISSKTKLIRLLLWHKIDLTVPVSPVRKFSKGALCSKQDSCRLNRAMKAERSYVTPWCVYILSKIVQCLSVLLLFTIFTYLYGPCIILWIFL